MGVNPNNAQPPDVLAENYALQAIIKRGVDDLDLRNEIYAQVIKCIYNNDDEYVFFFYYFECCATNHHKGTLLLVLGRFFILCMSSLLLQIHN